MSILFMRMTLIGNLNFHILHCGCVFEFFREGHSTPNNINGPTTNLTKYT